MPYGFIKHLAKKKYSTKTLESYEKVLSQFFSFLNGYYQKSIEPFEILPRDIKNYLEYQLKVNEKQITTVNKELAILKTFFHYLWEKDIVMVDPTVKIRRLKPEQEPNQIDVSYPEIQEALKKVLENNNYTLVRKAVFILATKGLKTSEFRFKKDDVTIINDDWVNIVTHNRSIDLKEEEARYFLEYYNSILDSDTPYVFTTTRRTSKEKVPVEVMSILHHLRAISTDYFPDKRQLTLLGIRKALMLHMYSEGIPIQKIAEFFGIEENSVANYVGTTQN